MVVLVFHWDAAYYATNYSQLVNAQRLLMNKNACVFVPEKAFIVLGRELSAVFADYAARGVS